jgi:hypothetical protein
MFSWDSQAHTHFQISNLYCQTCDVKSNLCKHLTVLSLLGYDSNMITEFGSLSEIEALGQILRLMIKEHVLLLVE